LNRTGAPLLPDGKVARSNVVERRWRYAPFARLATIVELVKVLAFSNSGRVRAIDWREGALLWTARQPRGQEST
jgi:hypothetical protein